MKLRKTYAANINGRIDKLQEQSKVLAGQIASVESRVDKAIHAMSYHGLTDLTKPKLLYQVKPVRGEPKGDAIQVDHKTKRELAAIAQALNLKDADELAQIVLHAFFDMYENDEPGHCITFPLMLQQVESA